jgi:prolyl 4-hydroxylase
MYFFSSLSAILLLQSTVVLGEMFTALSDLEGLVSTELELVRQLDTYIQEEENKLKTLRRYKILSSRLNALELIPDV